MGRPPSFVIVAVVEVEWREGYLKSEESNFQLIRIVRSARSAAECDEESGTRESCGRTPGAGLGCDRTNRPTTRCAVIGIIGLPGLRLVSRRCSCLVVHLSTWLLVASLS